MSQLPAIVALEKNKSLASRFNSRRANKDLQFQVECMHLDKCAAKNPDIAKCTAASLEHILLEAGVMGVSLNPSLHHAYVIPYKNSATGNKDAELNVGYRGMEHIVLKAGTVKAIQTVLVKEHDPVYKVWTDEHGKHIQHEEMRGNRGRTTHVYCIAHYMNGGYHIEEMTAGDLAECEKAAKSRNDKGGMVWRGPFREEMYKKCCVRRAYKHWPQDDGGRMAALMENMDRVEPMDFGVSSAPADGVTITEEDKLSLHTLLTDHGLGSDKAAAWLDRLAQQNGLVDIINLPHSKLAETKKTLTSYVQQWKANNG